MKTTTLYPQYAAIEQHIRRADLGRIIAISEAIAEFIVDGWKLIQAPPRPATEIINGRYHWMRHAAAHR
jgi:hypothetical protein